MTRNQKKGVEIWEALCAAFGGASQIQYHQLYEAIVCHINIFSICGEDVDEVIDALAGAAAERWEMQGRGCAVEHKKFIIATINKSMAH